MGKIALGLITNRSLTRKPHVGKLSSERGGGEEEEVRSGGGDMRKQSEKRGQVRGSESS